MYFFGSILKKETLNMYLFSMLIWAYFLSLKIYINSISTPNWSRLIKDTFTTFTSKDRMADEIAKTLSKHKWGTLFSVNFILVYILFRFHSFLTYLVSLWNKVTVYYHPYLSFRYGLVWMCNIRFFFILRNFKWRVNL